MKVGYIGLGAMGGLLASRLLNTHELWVYDLDESAVEALVVKGARSAGSPGEMAAACDVILLCLPRGSDVQALLFGSQGLAENLRPGTVVIDQTTGVPRESIETARELATRKVAMIDAPVSGGIPAATAGAVTIIGSGSDAAWAIAEPILDAISSKVLRSSDRVGDAQALKLINNAMGSGYRLGTLEMVAMSRKMGVPAARIVELLGAGPSASFTTRHMLPARLQGQATTDFSLGLLVKDLNGALALGTGVPMPITSTVRSVMQTGLNTIGMQSRLENLIDLVERMSGSVLTHAPLNAETGRDPDEAAPVIVSAVATCNRLIVYECAAVGAKFGLSVGVMNAALNSGSAWSRASEDILGDLGAVRDSHQSTTLGDVLGDLRLAAQFSATTHSPLFVMNVALAACEAATAEFGQHADSAAVFRHITERGAGITFHR